MSEFWNNKFAGEDYYYGTLPNEFFKQTIDTLPVGRLWVPGAGEGRDAVYAATLGWNAEAFDGSTVGQEKALKLAREKNVSIHYIVADAALVDVPTERYDLIALIYFHLPSSLRSDFHAKCIAALKPGGLIVVEAFNPKQLGNGSGGPQDKDMLYTTEDMQHDFGALTMLTNTEEQIMLNEGRHSGFGEVVRMVARK